MGKVLAGITISVDASSPARRWPWLRARGRRRAPSLLRVRWPGATTPPRAGEPAGEDKAWLEETLGANGAVIAGRGTYEAAGHWGGKNPGRGKCARESLG